MFQDDYKECNEQIRIDPTAEKRILAALRNGNKRSRFFGTRLAATVAVVVLVLLLVPLFAPGSLYGKAAYVCKSYEDILEICQSPEIEFSDLNDMLFLHPPKHFWSSSSNTSDTIPRPEGDTSSGKEDYSSTNIQVEGVDEADVVKTDGEYLYIASYHNKKLYIVRENNGNPVVESYILLNVYSDDADFTYSEDIEIFLYEDLLAVCTRGPYRGSSDTYYYVYDIRDRSDPKFVNTLKQSGDFISARMVGNVIYTVSRYSVYFPSFDKDTPYEDYVPKVRSDESGPHLLQPNEIYYCPVETSDQTYIVLTAFAIDASEKFIDQKAFLGVSPQVYADQENIYICSSQGIGSWSKENASSLLRFSIQEGKIKLAASGKVPGVILNQFSMDSYDGMFRIATTVDSYNIYMSIGFDFRSRMPYPYKEYRYLGRKNGIYILDNNLNLIGSVEGLAKGEEIYAVRFDRETGYVVTFEEVDPLFQIDLSNPRKPVVTDALKMPGVSNYLHVYDGNLIFGLGETGTEKGLTNGLKLSMFRRAGDQISLEEIHSFESEPGISYRLPESHKAIFVNSDKALIGLPVWKYGKYARNQVSEQAEYQLYRYTDSDGFRQVAAVRFDSSSIYTYSDCRGLYIGDFFYVVSPDAGIQVLSLADFTQKATLKF